MIIANIHFNITFLKDTLRIVFKDKDINEKLDFLKMLYDEFEDICYRYTDFDIKMCLTQYRLDSNYPPEPEGSFVDYKKSFVRYSQYSKFLNYVNNALLTFVIKEINKIEKEIIKVEKENSKPASVSSDFAMESPIDSNQAILIKFRWQKDNVLLPFLFEVLLDEGFISHSDYENRHDFIEQSFLKKNGKPFTSKESDQSELNYRSNSKNNKKPRNAFKVDRVAEKLKGKAKKSK